MTRNKSILSLLFVLPLVFVFATSINAQNASKVETYNRLYDAYTADLNVYKAKVAEYESAQAKYDKELKAYESEVRWHNALPADQRTDFQYRRLIRWQAELNRRCEQLNHHRDTKLEPVRKGLDKRYRELMVLYKQLDDD